MRILSNKKYGDLVEFENLYYKTQKKLDTMHIAFKRAQERSARFNMLSYLNSIGKTKNENKRLRRQIKTLKELLKEANSNE